jgi:hypothetical protein
LYEKDKENSWFIRYSKELYMFAQDSRITYRILAEKMDTTVATAREILITGHRHIRRAIDELECVTATPDSTMDVFIQALLDTRIIRTLKMGIGYDRFNKITVREFVDTYTIEDIKRFHNLGDKKYVQLSKAIESIGLKLKHSETYDANKLKEECKTNIKIELCKLREIDGIPVYKLEKIEQILRWL